MPSEQTIQAIPTRYAGYRMRSRLEARWAVVFDAMGLAWRYEPEGFILSNGTRYLPDFYLPDWGIWAEVKGDIKNEEIDLAIQFNKDVGPILLLWDMPEMFCQYALLCFTEGVPCGCWATFARIRGQCALMVERVKGKDIAPGKDPVDFYKELACLNRLDFVFGDSNHANTALEAGRSARFEFGESGASK